MVLRNFLKTNIRYLINLYISEKNKIFIGKVIKYIHSSIMYITLLILIFISKKFIIYIFIFTIFVFILFILNDFGCIISFIEKELLNDNCCDTDFYLNLLTLDITNNNRIIISLFGFCIQLYLLLLLYYLKHNNLLM